MISIKVNDTQKKISKTLSLQELVNELQVQTNGIAIAINNNVVKREEWTSCILQNNDAILIIKSTQGG
ncbi:Thiamine biosynthesis protein ThiS [Tenacibaculum sediminilitoris]|uniref:sulfur carrier protein ThiS n=1 Tax=Tenacibaculum sediminilitoris TaxID=1820334 RepID=UPI003893BACF